MSLLAAAKALLPSSSSAKPIPKHDPTSTSNGAKIVTKVSDTSSVSVVKVTKEAVSSSTISSSSSSSSSPSVQSASLSSTVTNKSRTNVSAEQQQGKHKKRSRPTDDDNTTSTPVVPFTSTINNDSIDNNASIDRKDNSSSSSSTLSLSSSHSSDPSAIPSIPSGTVVSPLYTLLYSFLETVPSLLTVLDNEARINEQIIYRNYNQHQSTKYWQHYHKCHRKLQQNIQLLQTFVHTVQQTIRRYERLLANPSYLSSLTTSFASSTVPSSSLSPHTYLHHSTERLLPILSQCIKKYEYYCTDTLLFRTRQYLLYQQQGLGYSNLFTVILTSLSVYWDYSIRIKDILVTFAKDYQRITDSSGSSSSRNSNGIPSISITRSSSSTARNGKEIITGNDKDTNKSTALMMETDDNLFTMDD